MPDGPARYGERYWCIGLADGTEVSLHADRIEIHRSGALQASGRFRHDEPEEAKSDIFTRQRLPSDLFQKKEPSITYAAFAAGQWTWFYAADVTDGTALAVDRWRVTD